MLESAGLQHSARPSRTELAHQLFRFLESESVPYVVVGDVRRYDRDIASDVDIVVAREMLPTIPRRLFTFCREERLRLVQVLQHERTAFYFVLSWDAPDHSTRYLEPDICGDFVHLGKRLLTAEELLTGRSRVAVHESGSTGFFVPAPAYSFIYYLLKKVDKRGLDDRQGAYLANQWGMDSVGAHAQLRRFFPEEDVALLARAAADNAWADARAALPRLRHTLELRMSPSLRERGAELVRKVRRVTEPTGLLVSVLGVDGAGKSTVISRLEEELAPAFRKVERYHLRPHFRRERMEAVPYTPPHSEPSRGRLLSIAQLALWWMDYVAGHLLTIRPRLVRSTLVMFDRYFYDVSIDPKRYRNGAPVWLTELVGKLVPAPDILIVLDAPLEVARSRKQEMEPEEIARQRQGYLRMAGRMRNAHRIDAADPLDEVVAATSRIVLEHLSARTASRLGLPANGGH